MLAGWAAVHLHSESRLARQMKLLRRAPPCRTHKQKPEQILPKGRDNPADWVTRTGSPLIVRLACPGTEYFGLSGIFSQPVCRQEYKSRCFPQNMFLEVCWQGRVSAGNPIYSIYRLSYLLGASAASTLVTYSFSVSWYSESQLLACFLTAHIAPFVSCCTQPRTRLENFTRKKKKKAARWSLNVKQRCQGIYNFHWSQQNLQVNRVRHPPRNKQSV